VNAPDVYLSFFMFTTDLRPGDPAYAKVVSTHIRELRGLGYAGFDLPIHPGGAHDLDAQVEAYRQLRRDLDQAGLEDVGFTTNVATTRTFDPTSPYREQRELALAYLRSRVDITAILRGSIMAGPIVFPYNVFPITDAGAPVWSDALQDWLRPRYAEAQQVLDQLGEYAAERDVSLAIEPVDHWETPAPNMVSDVLHFLEGVASRQVGVCVDSAHVVLGSSGPDAFRRDIAVAADTDRLHYVQVSAPDRGAVRDSWIPWDEFLGTVLPRYRGPVLIEVFNAIPAFLDSLRQTRRKFWIPGEDDPVPGQPDAYTVAAQAFDALRDELITLEKAGVL
jgi:D-psicose/D-tagatose/L-ribulose 3-epimerase